MTSAPRSAPHSSISLRRCALACLAAVVGVFSLDALLFRTGFYAAILEPDSSTGLFEMTLRREREAQGRYGDNMVATLGDSRFAYSPKIADQDAAKTGYILRQAGVAGTDARSWYYMLRDLDPDARRYRAIVFGVVDYDDEDELFNPFDDVRGLHYLMGRLRIGDVLPFAESFQSPELRWQAFRGSLLKGIVYQSDLLAFLSHPLKRLAYVQLCRSGYESWTWDYLETTRSMAGLSIDWNKWTATFPPGMDEDQRATVNASLMRRPAPQTGRLAAYRRLWYGRILDRYRGSRTVIVFARLPRGPVPRPDGLFVKRSAVIRDFARRPGVLLAPEHAFDSLERPELFKDGLHLNRAGIERFSPMLAEEIARLLNGEKAAHAF